MVLSGSKPLDHQEQETSFDKDIVAAPRKVQVHVLRLLIGKSILLCLKALRNNYNTWRADKRSRGISQNVPCKGFTD